MISVIQWLLHLEVARCYKQIRSDSDGFGNQGCDFSTDFSKDSRQSLLARGSWANCSCDTWIPVEDLCGSRWLSWYREPSLSSLSLTVKRVCAWTARDDIDTASGAQSAVAWRCSNSASIDGSYIRMTLSAVPLKRFWCPWICCHRCKSQACHPFPTAKENSWTVLISFVANLLQ